MKQRDDALDALKGVGITLVVIGHAWRGLYSAEVLANDALFSFIDRAIYAFHMPLFFFASGIVFNALLTRNDLSSFLRSRMIRLLWPLFLWSWIFAAVKLGAGDLQNTTMTLAEFPWIPLPPTTHMWFLWALFGIQVAIGVASYAFSRLLGTKYFLLGLLGVTLGLWGLAPDTMPYYDYIRHAVDSAPFFVLGMLCTPLQKVRLSPSVALGLAIFGLLAWPVAISNDAAGVKLICAAVIVLAIYGALLARRERIGVSRTGRISIALGRASFAIYVLHTIFSAGTREMLQLAGIHDLALHLILGTATGLWIPFVLNESFKRPRLRKTLAL